MDVFLTSFLTSQRSVHKDWKLQGKFLPYLSHKCSVAAQPTIWRDEVTVRQRQREDREAQWKERPRERFGAVNTK